MKKRFFLISLLLLAGQPVFAEDECADAACREEALGEAESRLSETYQAVHERLDKKAREELKKAQTAWEAEKNASLARQRYELLEARLREMESAAQSLSAPLGERGAEAGAPEVAAQIQPALAAQPASEEQWWVQVGSFKTVEQAEAMRQNLDKKGFQSQVGQSGEWYAVRLSPGQADKAEAEKQRQQYEKKSKSQAMLIKTGGETAPPGSPAPAKTARAGGPTLLALLYTDGQVPYLYPLAVREKGKYREATLKELESFTIFDRGQRIGEFNLQRLVAQTDCKSKKLGQGASDLSGEDLPVSEENDLIPLQGALLAMNSAAPSNATQSRAVPLPIERLALDNEQEAALLKTLENRFKLHLKELPKGYGGFAEPLAINLHEVNVYDLNGDGKAEYFAVASLPLAAKSPDQAAARASLFAWVELEDNRAAPLFDLFMPPQADAPDSVGYRVVDVIDLDGNAIPETVLQVGHGQNRRFEIYEYRQDRFEAVFSGAAVACSEKKR
jgi:cell division septation protein DedD